MLLGFVAAAATIGGCATGVKGSARRTCYDAGLQPGTAGFDDCWKAMAHRDNAAALNTALGVAAAYGVMQSGAVPAARAPFSSNRHLLIRESLAPSGDRLCHYDNGTVLNVSSSSCPQSVGQ